MKQIVSLALLLTCVCACRSEHGLDKPPPGYREPPPLTRTKQTFDPKSGRVTHEWNEIAYANRGAVKDGVETKYFANGRKMWEGTWERGRKRGTWTFWYESGAKKSETIYAAPQTTTMTFWHENGRLSLQGPAIDGSRQGHWRVWTNTGMLAEEGDYVGSLRQGEWKLYSDDGTKVTRVMFAKNRRVSAEAPENSEPVWQDALKESSTDSKSATAESRAAEPPVNRITASPGDFADSLPWETPWGEWNENQLAVSASGDVVVFAKYSSAHAQPEKNGVLETFVWSADAGVRGLSRARIGGRATSHSCSPSASSDGSRIAYVTYDAKVAQCGTCELPQPVFVDTVAGATRALTASASSARGGHAATSGVLSRDGREFVFFGNVGASPGSGGNTRFVPIRHDVATGVEQLVWSPPQGVDVETDTVACSASGDFVVLTVRGLGTDGTQVVRIQRGKAEFDALSRTDDGVFGYGSSFQPSISADGKVVAFLSRARNLVSDPQRADADADVYVWQAKPRRIFRPELPVLEGARYVNVLALSLSDDGTRVALTVELAPADWTATSSVTRPPKSRTDVVVCDLRDGSSSFVTRAANGALAHGSSAFATLSGDGKKVAFLSYAPDIAPLTDVEGEGKLVAPGVFVAQLGAAPHILRID